MTLDQYLKSPGAPKAAEFGRMCQPPISEGSISRIRKGLQNLTGDMMRSIIIASGGKVTAEELLAVRVIEDRAA